MERNKPFVAGKIGSGDASGNRADATESATLRSKGALALAKQADAKRQKGAIPPAFHAGRGRPAYSQVA